MLFRGQNDEGVKGTLAQELLHRYGSTTSAYQASIDAPSFDKIKIQFLALNFVELKELPMVGGGIGLFWYSTASGKQAALELVSTREGAGPATD